MRLLKMLLLSPFTFLLALTQALLIFLLVFKMAWDMLRKVDKERYL